MEQCRIRMLQDSIVCLYTIHGSTENSIENLEERHKSEKLEEAVDGLYLGAFIRRSP